jgi:hypothetical protein
VHAQQALPPRPADEEKPLKAPPKKGRRGRSDG